MSTYREYYSHCRTTYHGDPSAIGVYALGVHVHAPGRPTAVDLLTLNERYLAAVDQLGAEVQRRVDDGVGIYHNPDRHAATLSIQLETCWDSEALQTIAEILVPQAEERILGCYGLINQVTLIRSLPTAASPASSWLWHYDNKPDEAFKMLIYLTPVDELGGAFEYLRHTVTGDVVKVGSSRESADRVGAPRWLGSRVPPEAMAEYETSGYAPHRAAGPRGTLIAFDNNCIHRATVPARTHRDALILNLRPSDRQVRPRISRAHTGSWSFNAKQWIPELLEIPAAV